MPLGYNKENRQSEILIALPDDKSQTFVDLPNVVPFKKYYFWIRGVVLIKTKYTSMPVRHSIVKLLDEYEEMIAQSTTDLMTGEFKITLSDLQVSKFTGNNYRLFNIEVISKYGVIKKKGIKLPHTNNNLMVYLYYYDVSEPE